MAWSSEDRRKFLRALDETESRLLVLYRYLLYFLIVSVTVLAVLFYRSVAKDAFRDFLRLFGGILYLTFLAWAVGQLFAIREFLPGSIRKPAFDQLQCSLHRHGRIDQQMEVIGHHHKLVKQIFALLAIVEQNF